MKLLLDTHTLLWFVLGDASLSATARQLIEDSTNSKLVSPASYWELAVKISIGKYALHEPYETFLDRAVRQNGFLILPNRTAPHCRADQSAVSPPRSLRPIDGRPSNGRRPASC